MEKQYGKATPFYLDLDKFYFCQHVVQFFDALLEEIAELLVIVRVFRSLTWSQE